MVIQHALEPDDFLQYHLYNRSKNGKAEETAPFRGWLNCIAPMFLLALVHFLKEEKMPAYSFLALAVLIFALYPLFQRYYYQRYYRKLIANTYQHSFGITSTLTIGKIHLETVDPQVK